MTENVADIEEYRSRIKERRGAEEAMDSEEEKKRGDGGGGEQKGPTSKFIRACLRMNQMGDGELYKALNEGKFVFCKNRQAWLKWTGHHWAEDIMNEAVVAVETVAAAFEKEAAGIKREIPEISDNQIAGGMKQLSESLEKRANQLRGTNRRAACLEFAHTSENPMAIGGDELDTKHLLLGCANGVVELETGTFRPGRQDDWILKASPHNWEGINAKCEAFEKAILECMGDDETMAEFMHRLYGSSISGKVVEKKFPVFIGPHGDNGKTTVMEAISYAVGPLGGPVSSDMLTAGYKPSGSGIDTAMMSLKGLRIAYASETEDGAKVSAPRVKKMTGKDTLTARSPYDKRDTDFEPTHTLFLLSNFKLRADTEDAAFWNRIIYIPFNIRFVDNPKKENERKAKPYLDEELRKEAPGILAWLVRGYQKWRTEGLNIPQKVIEESKRTREDLDYFGAFIDECCDKIENDAYGVGSSEIYNYFDKWYKKNIGNFVPKIKTFGTYMKAHYQNHKTNGVVRYYGLLVNYEAVKVYDPDAQRTDFI